MVAEHSFGSNAVPSSVVWESNTRFAITFSSYAPGGLITFHAPTASNPSSFRSVNGVAMSADVTYQFPSGPTPPPSSGPPSVTSLNFIATTPARLEVNFSQPMNPTYFTTGSYVPTSSVWETTPTFVITFSSYTPGGTITLKAPTATDPRGFKSASGTGMEADAIFQFP
mgnify:CR=1 FL=1